MPPACGRAEVYVLAAPDNDVCDTVLPLIIDTDGEFTLGYQAKDVSVFVIRPDGYLGLAARGITPGSAADVLVRHLRATFG